MNHFKMIKLYFVFLSIFAINLGEGQLIGSNPCTWGPSFWCANLSNAHRCENVNWCIDMIWGKPEYTEDGNDQMNCNICATLVRKSREQLETSDDEEDLKRVFEKSCRKLRIQNVKSKCRILVNQNFPELLAILESEMSSEAVCKAAGLCGDIETSIEDSNNANSDLHGKNKCSWGPSYWCRNLSNARSCGSGALDYCRRNVWNDMKPDEPVGSNRCTWGPAYWCKNEDSAIECNALEYCETHEWLAK